MPKSDGGTKDEKSKWGFGFCAFESMIAWRGVVALGGTDASAACEVDVPAVEIGREETEDDGGFIGEGETHRSTFENGLCPGVFGVLVVEADADPPVDAGPGLGDDPFPAVLPGFRLALFLDVAGTLALTGDGDLEEDGEEEEEPRVRPARRRSERSARGPLAAAAALPGDGDTVAGE